MDLTNTDNLLTCFNLKKYKYQLCIEIIDLDIYNILDNSSLYKNFKTIYYILDNTLVLLCFFIVIIFLCLNKFSLFSFLHVLRFELFRRH